MPMQHIKGRATSEEKLSFKSEDCYRDHAEAAGSDATLSSTLSSAVPIRSSPRRMCGSHRQLLL